MPEKLPEDLTPEALEERNRCLAVIEMFEEYLKTANCFEAIWNRIQFGADPRDASYMDDRLMP